MSVVFESPRVSLNYLPEDAFYVFDAMQKASSLASGSFFEAYVLAPISRANAVLGSLVNIPIYCIQGIYSDPNVAFNAAMQSTIFVALGFFYIVGLDFFLDQSAGVAPIISDPRVPEPMSSQSDGPSESPYQRSLGALRETAETIESTIREVRDREWFDRLRESFQTIIAAHRALTSNEEMDHTVIFYFSHGEESERQISFLINSERQFIEALEILEWNFDLLSRRVHENASSSISHSNSGEIEPLSDRFERTWIRTYNDWNGRAHSVRSRKYRVPMQIYLEELRSVLDTSLFNEFNPANPFHALIQTLNYNLNHPTLDARSDYLTFVNTLRLIIIHDDYRAILENSSRSSVERRILDLVEHCNNTRWASTELYEFSSNYLSLILDAAVAAEHPGLTHSFPELSLANFSNELQKLNNLVKEAPQSVKKGHLGVIAQRLRGEIGTEDFTGVMNIPFLREKQVFIKNGQEQEISCLRHGCPTTGGSYWRAFGRMITNAVNRVNPTFYNLPDVDSGEEVASDFLDFIRSQTEREGFFITVHQSRIAQSITGTEHQRVGKIVELQETFEHLHVLVQGMDGDFFKRQTSRFTEITTFHELARELVNQFTQSDSDYGPGKICDLPNRLKNDPSYRAELEHIFSTVHQILFEGRECIEAGDAEWQSFINFCYSMQRMDLKFRLSSEEHPISTCVNFCKDNIDRGPAQALVESMLFLMMTGEEITHEKLKEIAVHTLASAPMVKGKEMLNSRLILARGCIDILARLSSEKLRDLRALSFDGWKPHTSLVAKRDNQEACPIPSSSMSRIELYDSLRHLQESRARPMWKEEIQIMEGLSNDLRQVDDLAFQGVDMRVNGDSNVLSLEEVNSQMLQFIQQQITSNTFQERLACELRGLTVESHSAQPSVEITTRPHESAQVTKEFILKSSEIECARIQVVVIYNCQESRVKSTWSISQVNDYIP